MHFGMMRVNWDSVDIGRTGPEKRNEARKNFLSSNLIKSQFYKFISKSLMRPGVSCSLIKELSWKEKRFSMVGVVPRSP